MATFTATDYFVYPVRTVHVGVNRMHTNVITAAPMSASASDEIYMFPIPNDCMVTGGVISASAPSGLTTNVILQVGFSQGGAAQNETIFGTYTVSGSAALAATRLNIYAPKTVSSSGADTQTSCTIAVLSAGTTTTSLSIYLMLEYVMPGNIN